MKLKNTLISLSILSASATVANDNINYNYLDLSYGYSATSNHRDDTFKLGGSFSLNDNFYLVASAKRLIIDQKRVDVNNIFTQNNYSLSLGFHTSISKRNDFYAEVGHNNSRISVPYYDEVSNTFKPFNYSKNDFIASIGTRTAFGKKFELITGVHYKSRQSQYISYPVHEIINGSPVIEGFNTFGNKSNINLSVSGLYKFNDKNSLRFGIDEIDGFILGYRFNW